MSFAASCPQCGAEVRFRLDLSRLSVCGHCGCAVARKDADLESYGKVADLIPTPSLLDLGIEGRDPDSKRAFQIIGRLQLDHGAGTWDEWFLALGGEQTAWLAESQGRFHLMREVPAPPLPPWDALPVGSAVDLGPAGSFVVVEVKQARFKSAAGELPFDIQPGAELHYIDLQGPRDRLATIDYGAGRDAEAVYVGTQVPLAELGIASADLKSDDDRLSHARGGAIGCTQCGGPLEIRAPDQTLRVACPYCGSILDASDGRYAVLQLADRVSLKPAIELGSKGRLMGDSWTAIGCMERSVRVEGTRYPWREYLLYQPQRGFCWLLESNGHWSFVRPLNASEFKRWKGPGGSSLWHDKKRFKHFQSGVGQVDEVIGEFYWAVAREDRTEMHDYVHPPTTISIEKTADEIHFSEATYLEPAAIWRAFGIAGEPPVATGVAPNQPWPKAATASSIWRAAAQVAALLVLLFFVFSILGGRVVYTQTVTIPGTGAGPSAEGPEAPDRVTYTTPFTVPRRGNLKVEVRANLGTQSGSWLYLDGALIDEKVGYVVPFDLEASYYAGSDWKEDKRRTSRYLPAIAAGEYVLRLAPQWSSRPDGYTLRVVHGVPRARYLLLSLFILGLVPALYAAQRLGFESRRWSESDHPWGEQS